MVRLLASLLLLPAAARAEEPVEHAGRVLAVRAGAIKVPGAAAFAPLARNQGVPEGAVIKTEPGGAIRLLMSDRSILDVGPASHVTVTRYQLDRSAKKRSVGLHVFVGKLWARVSSAFGQEISYEVHTANAVAGVRGTQLIVSVELSGRAEVICVDGAVEVASRAGGEPLHLGPLDVSSIDNRGGQEQRRATADEIQKHADSMRVGGSLDAGKAKERLEDAERSAGKEPGSGEARPEKADDEESKLDELNQEVAPPLDLEPGSGNSRVKGRVEVRER